MIPSELKLGQSYTNWGDWLPSSVTLVRTSEASPDPPAGGTFQAKNYSRTKSHLLSVLSMAGSLYGSWHSFSLILRAV